MKLNTVLSIVSATLILSLLNIGLGLSLSVNGRIHAPFSSNIPKIDGQWSTPTEWTDASETKIEDNQNMTTFLRIKHNLTYIFVLLDFITDSTQSTYDLAGICFDTLDDGGHTPGDDDYIFGLLAGQAPNFVYAYHGTGTDGRWALTYVYGISGSAGFSKANDPYESVISHRAYEWQIPRKALGQAPFYGFYVFACDFHTETLLQWPNEAGGNWQSGSSGSTALANVPPPCENWGDVASDFVSEPKTIYIDDDNTLGPWDGTPDQPYQNITSGLEHAIAGDTIFVYGGTYCENVVVDKMISLIGENRNNTIIDGHGTGTVLRITANNTVISNFLVQNCGAMVSGIRIESFNNIISENDVRNNYRGLRVIGHKNIISNNSITHNQYYGIHVEEDATNNIIEGNTITSHVLGIVLLNRCNNCTITNNYISRNIVAGIELTLDSHNCRISNNNLINNGDGINVYHQSDSNIIKNNYIANNSYFGIKILSARNNLIFHNNFINNTDHVWISDSYDNIWDDGYPFGGNYWSDYNGVDENSGPNQNENGSDWIGDTPYIIDEENQDNYPLMDTYLPKTQNIQVAYRKLLGNYNALLSDFNSLNSTYYELLQSYYDLISNHTELQGFQNSLSSSYNNLNATYNELKSKQETTINELDNIKNLMYAFMAATIILTVTTAYFAKTKPKF